MGRSIRSVMKQLRREAPELSIGIEHAHHWHYAEPEMKVTYTVVVQTADHRLEGVFYFQDHAPRNLDEVLTTGRKLITQLREVSSGKATA